MKTDIQQRMVDHMLETSKLMNDNNSIICISSDSEEEKSGSVIDLTGVEKEESEMESQCQDKDMNNVLTKNNGNQTSTDTDTFCAKFNSVFDKNIAKDKDKSASSDTREGTSGEELAAIPTHSNNIDADLISSVSPSRSPSPSPDSVLASNQRSPVKDTTQNSNEIPVDHSTSENQITRDCLLSFLNQVSSSKLIHSTSGTSSDLSEAMPDVVQNVTQYESFSSHTSQMDLCDETNVHMGEKEKNTTDNKSVMGRRKRPSGRKEDVVIADTPEENIEIMKRTLRCFQCHRVFLSTEDVEDENHYCAFYGNLKTPLRIDPSPTPSKKVSLKCVICPSPVFSDSTELMKHIILGHEIDWFIEDAEDHLHVLTEDDHALHECWDCDCDDWAETEEDYFLHQGIHHGRLFWALKHNRKHNFKNLCKRLFPGKMKDNPDLVWSEDSMDEIRKRLRSDEECEENTDESSEPSAKRILLLADKSREEEERSDDDSQEDEGMDQDEDSDNFFPREYSVENKNTDNRNKDSGDMTNGEAGKGTVEDPSTEKSISVTICVKETSMGKEYCNYCHEWFSRRERISHGCVQAFEPKIIDDIVLQGSEDDSDGVSPLSSKIEDINKVMTDPKDMRKAIMEVCSDEKSDDGERSGISDGQEHHAAQPLEAWG